MFGLKRVMFVSHKRLKGGKFKNKWGVVVQHQNEITRLIISGFYDDCKYKSVSNRFHLKGNKYINHT